MLFNKTNNTDADAFWKSREEELGTVIRCKTLGRVVQKENWASLWGLLYATDNAVYFQTFESENWMSLIFSKKKSLKQAQNKIIEIPVSSLIRCEHAPQKKGLLKIFQQPPFMELTWNDTDTGEEKTFLIEIEGRVNVCEEIMKIRKNNEKQ